MRKSNAEREYEREFIAFCDKNNLRRKRSEDGFPIAIGTGKRKGDHFFDGFKGAAGVWVERDTKKKFSFAHKKMIKMGCTPLVTCDSEGTYTIPYEEALPVAKFLRLVKGKRRGKYAEEQDECSQ